MIKIDSNYVKNVPLDTLNNIPKDISVLSPEMLTEIFSHLDTNNHANCFLVNKDFQFASVQLKKTIAVKAFFPHFVQCSILMDKLGYLTNPDSLNPTQNPQTASCCCLPLTTILAIASIASSVFLFTKSML